MINRVQDSLDLVRAKSEASHPALELIKIAFLLLEYWWGLLATFMIAFFPPLMFLLFGLGSLVSEPADRLAPPWAFLLGLLISAPLAFWEVKLTLFLSAELLAAHNTGEGTGGAQGKPTDAYRLTLPEVPRLCAPFLSLWWLAHFAGGVLACRGAEAWVIAAYGDPSPLTKYLWSQGIGLAFTVAMNHYLLLAIAVFVRNPGILVRLWRWRFVIDAVVTVPTSLAAAWDWLP